MYVNIVFILDFGKRSFNNKQTAFAFCLAALIGFGNNVVGGFHLHFSPTPAVRNAAPPPGANAARGVSSFFLRSHHYHPPLCEYKSTAESFANDGVIYIAVARRAHHQFVPRDGGTPEKISKLVRV
jgi:hypothetical protein